jgi:hypothetical protein
MAKKRNVLKDILESIYYDEDNNIALFKKYIMRLSSVNFGVEEKENFLKEKYNEILQFYREGLKDENQKN